MHAATAAVTTSPWFELVEACDDEVVDEVSVEESDFEESDVEVLESVEELLVVDEPAVDSVVDEVVLPTTNTCCDGVAGWWWAKTTAVDPATANTATAMPAAALAPTAAETREKKDMGCSYEMGRCNRW